MKKNDTVFYDTDSTTIRARVKTVHRDGSASVEALFYQRDGKDVPGLLGFTYRLALDDLSAIAPVNLLEAVSAGAGAT